MRSGRGATRRTDERGIAASVVVVGPMRGSRTRFDAGVATST